MDEQTLELQIHSNAQKAIAGINKLLTDIGIVDKSVSKVTTTVNKNGETVLKNLTSISKEGNNVYKVLQKLDENGKLKVVSTSMNALKSSTEKAANTTGQLNKALSLGGAYLGVKRLTTNILTGLKASMDYSESLNLFNVVFDNVEKNGVTAFSNIGKEATKFQNKLAESFGTSKTQSLTYQALYQSMAENMSIPNNIAAIMSETTVKMINDLSSLYNKPEKSVANALSSGVYAGQVRPLRNYGLDITEKSLQPVLDSLGIERTVRDLSQAEKQLLRYITVVKQSAVAHSDWANTIESPSNQLKIFTNQLVETKVAVSSLFIGTFSSILPYANAFLMVIKEISKAIAMMFGIELKDYNTGIASQEGIYDGIADSVDNATGKVKELKRQTLGFDEIHNINENKDTGGGSGSSGAVGGIDQRLLDAIKGYDNGMESVRMKATEIRDRIMEWLGFTKKLNPLTGETYFEYQGIDKTLKNMWKSFKGLSTQGKILVGLGLVVGATKLWNVGKKLITVFGNSGLYKIIKSLYSPTKLLFDNMLIGLKSSHSSLTSGITSWREQMGIIDKTTGKVDGFKGAMNGAKVAVSGLITGAVGLYTINQSMKSLCEDGANLVNVLGLVGGELSTIASGAQVGAVFGPWGAVIGGATGAVIGLTSALLGYENQGYKNAEAIIKSTKATNEYSDSLLAQYDAISKNLENETSLSIAHSNLIDELESIVDVNGKVKAGYEDRVQFIISVLNNAYGSEISMVDGVISKLDEQISKIRDVIAEKRKEIALQSASQAYQIAINETAKTYDNFEKSVKNYNMAISEQERYENKLKEAWDRNRFGLQKQYGTYENYLAILARSENGYMKVISATENAKTAMDNATNAYDANTMAIMQYEGLLASDAQNNAEAVNYWMNEIQNTYKNGKEIIKLTYDQQIKDSQEYYDSVIRTSKQNGQQITDEIKAQANSRLNTVTQNLREQCTSVENITPEIVKAWATLGKENKDKFLENFKELPKDVQTEIVDKMQNKGYNISNELQKGIEQINPEIHVKSKVDKATITIDADTSRAKQKTNNWLSSLFDGIGGFLGLKEAGGIYSNGTWKNISQYANGGAPSHGSMFVAGEHGAEIVGHINGKTEVLNQSQIASAIYSAVASAMSQYAGGGIAEINVHADKGIIVETAVNGIQQHVNQTGTLPFDIPAN